jgi:hypothetical protein
VSTELVHRRDYLADNRRMILGRSIAGVLAGAVPLPFLDDWLIRRILGNAYRKIAAAHRVDLEDASIEKLVHGRTSPRAWTEIAGTAIAYRMATMAWKRFLLALTTVRRARAASRQFVVMTLFEHYCARLHVGLALDAPTALAVRDTIVAAIEQTPGGLSFEPFRRGARSAARATLRAPLELADMVSGGRLRRLLERNTEVAEPEQVTALEQAIDEALADQTSFLARAVTAVELQLSSEVNPYLDAVISRFDDLWRRRQAPEPDPVPAPA